MKNKNENAWIWPEELDALTAAPQHHKLLFENEAVRVIDTCIPPGEITELHTHKWPAAYYILSWSDFLRYDDNGTILVDSRRFPEAPAPFTSLWSEPLTPHTLENIGDKDIHLISTEIKS
jgi:hypothetical protein